MNQSVCLLRLSAIGDCTHALPLATALRDAGHAVTWIIGRIEHRLLEGLPGIEFAVYDKRNGWRELLRLRRSLRGRRFDALLLMQLSLRAALVSTSVRADRRIGYEAGLSREGHGLFINERCPPSQKTHVLDVLCGFGAPLGIDPVARRWEIPLADGDHGFAREHLAADLPNLVISPCSSHVRRNWLADRYAAVADHAVRTGWQVTLVGGPSAVERQMADQIVGLAKETLVDLTGKDTLKQLAATLGRADAVIAPDTGPAHIANAMGTRVIGLHAATDPLRSGPYNSLNLCVNRYGPAAERFMHCHAHELRWGAKIEVPGVMELVDAACVIERIDALRDA